MVHFHPQINIWNKNILLKAFMWGERNATPKKNNNKSVKFKFKRKKFGSY